MKLELILLLLLWWDDLQCPFSGKDGRMDLLEERYEIWIWPCMIRGVRVYFERW